MRKRYSIRCLINIYIYISHFAYVSNSWLLLVSSIEYNLIY